MRAGKILFWLGIVVLVVGLAADGYNVIHLLRIPAIGMNVGATVSVMLSPLWQGGVLIGLGKILERLDARSRRDS